MKTSTRKSFCFTSGLALFLISSIGRNVLAQEGTPAVNAGSGAPLAQMASIDKPSENATPDENARPGESAGFLASSSSTSSTLDLPEAPQPAVASPPSFSSYQSGTGGTASRFSTSIEAGMTASQLSAGDKFLLGFRAMVSPGGFAGTVIGAGYSHLVNGQPNYGTDRGAFGERVGAGVLRSASQDFFNISVLSPVLHQDPRYYVQGSQRPLMKRILYAATRPIIGRTDGGHTTVNASLLIGYAGAAALTTQYYPPVNHDFRDVASTYGSSLGGAAIGFIVDEFADQLLRAIHLRK